MESYIPVLLFVLVAVGFVIVAQTVARLLRHGGSGNTNADPYECGNEPESLALEHRFSIRYYLIAVLFVVFDVETVFMFPWAVIMDELLLFGLIEMMVFLLILVVGYAYAWRKGALDWV